MTEKKKWSEMTEKEKKVAMAELISKIEANKCPNCGSPIGLMPVMCYGLNGPAEVCRSCGFAKQGSEVVNRGRLHRGGCF